MAVQIAAFYDIGEDDEINLKDLRAFLRRIIRPRNLPDHE